MFEGESWGTMEERMFEEDQPTPLKSRDIEKKYEQWSLKCIGKHIYKGLGAEAPTQLEKHPWGP